MASLRKIEGIVKPEITVFHEFGTTIATRLTGTPDAFYPAGYAVKATGAGAGKPVNYMEDPEGTVLVATGDEISALTAHDIKFDEEGKAQAAVVISGVYYTQNLPTLPGDVALTETQLGQLAVQGLIRYGVPVPKK